MDLITLPSFQARTRTVWITETRKPNPPRSLNGLVDEFLIVGRALGDKEIWRLYENGKPF